MQKITKQTEPAFLIHYRNLQGAEWNRDVKKLERDQARAQLCSEQGALCCFCEGRIRPTEHHMKVAHFVPQDVNRSLMFNWNNLLGACKGGEGNAYKKQHCDTRQGSQELSSRLHPVTLAPGTIDFNTEGKVLSSDATANEELNTKLNLNLDRLVRNRKSAADAMIAQMGKESWKVSDIERKLKELAAVGVTERIEYQSYLAWWLRRRLQKAA
jgi:uncharacterized protein (TIGR02646 family)